MPPAPASNPLDDLPTEQPHPTLRDLDCRDAAELVELIHQQDREALAAVAAVRDQLARAVERVAAALDGGGRLIYVGAGTSGRLAALDAAECPPTFGSDPSQVVAVIAGGRTALHRAVEGAEDSRAAGRSAIRTLGAGASDVVCGVSASGVTPFVVAALAEARRRGSHTLLVTAAPTRVVAEHAALPICLDLGAEPVAGSTRMKAGLATKAVLHTLSTAAMIRLGKVHDNLMVDLQPTSRKLRRRAERVVSTLAGVTTRKARRLLVDAGDRIKVAVVMHRRGVDAAAAAALLRRHGDRLRPALEQRDDPRH